MQFFMLNSKIKFIFFDLEKQKLDKNSEMSFWTNKETEKKNPKKKPSPLFDIESRIILQVDVNTRIYNCLRPSCISFSFDNRLW